MILRFTSTPTPNFLVLFCLYYFKKQARKTRPVVSP